MSTFNPPYALVLPDTLLALPSGERLTERDRANFAPPPALARLLARGVWGGLMPCEGDPLENWLFQHLRSCDGIQAGATEALSVPPWAMLGAPAEAAYRRWWVSPVHVAIGREGVSLTPPDALELQAHEITGFQSAILAVLATAGWRAVAGPPWACGPLGQLLEHDEPLPQALPSPWGLARHRMTDLLPADPAMAQWRRLWMEVQMALHEHPLNQDRISRGQPPVNACWWWGGGPSPGLSGSLAIKARLTDLADPACKATTLQAGSSHRVAAWLAPLLHASGEANADASVVHLIDNANPGLWMSAAAQHPVVRALDSEWVAPLAAAAVSHQLVLLGHAHWRTVASSWRLRTQIWKNSPRPDDLVESLPGLLDESALARAWQDAANQSTPDGGEFHPERF